MVDTNVLFSALFFPRSLPARVLEYAAAHHDLVVTSHIARELRRNAARKRPDLALVADAFLDTLRIVEGSENHNAPRIRDETDQPILEAAIANDVDIILTGDRDFLALQLERPRIMSPSVFHDTYMAQND